MDCYREQFGCYVVKIHGEHMQERGISDLIGCIPVDVAVVLRMGIERVGLFFADEVKQPGEGPSKIQEYHHELVQKAGGLVHVSHSLKEAEQWAKSLTAA